MMENNSRSTQWAAILSTDDVGLSVATPVSGTRQETSKCNSSVMSGNTKLRPGFYRVNAGKSLERGIDAYCFTQPLAISPFGMIDKPFEAPPSKQSANIMESKVHRLMTSSKIQGSFIVFYQIIPRLTHFPVPRGNFSKSQITQFFSQNGSWAECGSQPFRRIRST